MGKLQSAGRKGLTNAYEREKLTHGSVMVKITYHDKLIECSDASEAIDVLKFIERREQEARVRNIVYKARSEAEANEKFGYLWTARSFREFVDSLGESQTRVLGLLVRQHKVFDDELRKALKLDSNQQLAGVLSGISKQAAALNIPARSIFLIENESKSGETTKAYTAAGEFRSIAGKNNWPED